jgi:hypothetical protein
VECEAYSSGVNRKDKEIKNSVLSACPVKFTIVKSKAHFTGATRAKRAVNKILQIGFLSKNCKMEKLLFSNSLKHADDFRTG